MGKFKATRRHALAYLGEGWEECYINLSPLTYREARELQGQAGDGEEAAAKVLEVLKRHISGGKGRGQDGLVDITADDLEDLPIEVIGKLTEDLGGSPDPNS